MVRAPALLNVQALRAVAALLVVVAHLESTRSAEAKVFGTASLPPAGLIGATGVDLFFVISGFIMVVTTSRIGDGPRAARAFIVRRITRVYPPYLVITAAIFVLYVVRPGLVNAGSTGPKTDVLASFLLLPQAGYPLLLVGWTLSYEMYFYVVFALSVLVPRSVAPAVLAGWAAVTLLLGVVVHPGGVWGHFLSSPLHLEFLLGVLVGALFTRLRQLPLGRLVAVVAGIAVAATWGAVFLGDDAVIQTDAFRVALLGPTYALLLYAAVSAEQQRRLTAAKPLVVGGNISYSLYLTHLGAVKLLVVVFSVFGITGTIDRPAFLVLALMLCVLVAFAFHRAVERPLLRIFQGHGQLLRLFRRTARQEVA